MACAGASVFDLAGGRQTEPLLGSLVGFHLWHGWVSLYDVWLKVNRPIIINDSAFEERGIR